jgi:hypothetical protein
VEFEDVVGVGRVGARSRVMRLSGVQGRGREVSRGRGSSSEQRQGEKKKGRRNEHHRGVKREDLARRGRRGTGSWRALLGVVVWQGKQGGPSCAQAYSPFFLSALMVVERMLIEEFRMISYGSLDIMLLLKEIQT